MKKDIVIIDSGVCCGHPMLKGSNISGITIRYDIDRYYVYPSALDEIGHGTAVTGTILSLVKEKSECEILVIKIYEEEAVVELDKLLFALSYIENEVECHIVHISSGVLEYSKKLEEQCRRLSKKGICIVAAFDNNGAVSYPAAFSEVIGVDSSYECMKSTEWIYVENGIVNILAKGGNHRLAWTSPEYILSQGASFSAGYITAVIANQIKHGMKKEEIKEFLREKAIKVYNRHDNNYAEKISGLGFQIRQAVLFPYNKEMHSLVNFYDMLPFNLQGVFSSRYLGNIGQMATSLDGQHTFLIENIDDIDWESVETFILGHVFELSRVAHLDYKDVILDKCLEYGINVYAFDGLGMEKYQERFSERGLNLFYPNIDAKDVIRKDGKLYSIKSPVLGIFGTSSAQGKYTLQLLLRRLLMEQGYIVGQMGTEPTGLLFGMDAMYPFGYTSSVAAKEEDAVEIINDLMHEIDVKNPDIILVGSQSGTIPAYFYNTKYLNTAQQMYLLGTNPDAVILCVNIQDEYSYIKRTIAVIENLTISKVIAIVVSPLIFTGTWSLIKQKKECASSEQIERFINQLGTQVTCPVYSLEKVEKMDNLLETCLSFFSEVDGA